ncbi:MAG TPA: VOC family protein [Acidimicrobiia bacterium]|nr:VOC family protein [Acidimicrobiia bacterium]
MPEIAGISHIDLTVTDIERSLPFYTDVLGFTAVARENRADREMVVLRHPGLANSVCLNAHHQSHSSLFDERSPGLDHLSFRVANRSELDAWLQQLEAHGVSHSAIADTPHGPVLVFRDPDNIQLELMAPPGS